MICHICQKTLVGDRYAPKHARNWYHCPDGHILNVAFDSEGNITQYMVFWDDNERQARYKLESYFETKETFMSYRPFQQRETEPGYVPNSQDAMKRRWSSVMSFPSFIPLSIKDDMVVMDNIVNRLMKLRAFA